MRFIHFSTALVIACGLLLWNPPARAGEEWGNDDRPDLLNFDPFDATGAPAGAPTSNGPYTNTFTTMGMEYTSTFFFSYTTEGIDCFSDPDPELMLNANLLCFYAGDYAVEWYGFFRVDTGAGGILEAGYAAFNHETVKRSHKKGKSKQKAWVGVFGEVFETVEMEVEDVAEFDSYFELCEFKGTAKGEGNPAGFGRFEVDERKEGVLEKGKGKLECDADAVTQMIAKLRFDCDDDTECETTATSIFQTALAKLEDKDTFEAGKTELEIEVKADGPQFFSDDDLEEMFEGFDGFDD